MPSIPTRAKAPASQMFGLWLMSWDTISVTGTEAGMEPEMDSSSLLDTATWLTTQQMPVPYVALGSTLDRGRTGVLICLTLHTDCAGQDGISP